MLPEKPPANTNRPCPICGHPSDLKHRPFCSTRCADVDLHRWLGGVYRVETQEVAEENARPAEE